MSAPQPLAGWLPRPLPAREALAGRWVALQPLDAARHGEDLFRASMAPGADERFRWLPDAPQERAGFERWLASAAASEDPLFYAVVDAPTGRCVGRQALMRIAPEHGAIEVGHILWGPALARTRGATEALYLFARHAFDALGYRRLEWKCNALNAPSRRAALRFGFTYEGTFRQHMVVKGESRDTAWFSITDGEWPALRAAFERWLAPQNFDADGRQRARLEDLRQGS